MDYKPIIKNDELDLNNLFLYIFRKNNKIIKVCFLAMILFSLYFFISTPKYSSSVSFYTNYQSENSSTQSFLSSFGSNLLAESELQFSIKNYINSDKFLDEIVQKAYKVDGREITLIDLWGNNYNNYLSLNPIATLIILNRNLSFGKNINEYDKKRFHAKSLLMKNMVLIEDSESNLHTLSVNVRKHPNLSREIIEVAYRSIINFSYQITKLKSEEKISFIQSQLKDVERSLNNAESNMIEFLESNNSIKSPTLLVEKNRLDTEISLFSQLYISLNDQLELAKIDQKDITSSVYLLDKPAINPLKSGSSLIKGYIIFGIITYFFSIIFLIYKDRKKIIFFD